jgi:hypothetical protein
MRNLKVKPFILTSVQLEYLYTNYPKSIKLFESYVAEVTSNGNIEALSKMDKEAFCRILLEKSPRALYDFFNNENAILNNGGAQVFEGINCFPLSQASEWGSIKECFNLLEYTLLDEKTI